MMLSDIDDDWRRKNITCDKFETRARLIRNYHILANESL